MINPLPDGLQRGRKGADVSRLLPAAITLPPVSTFHCSDAVARDVQFSSGTITATITGIVMSGTTTEIYTIKVSGAQTSVGNMAAGLILSF